jgi:hypothetical protein
MVLHGGDTSMWLQEDSLARTSHWLERVMGLMGSEVDCGPKWPGSLAKFSLRSFSWRTAQCSIAEGLTEFSEILPRWGMMRDGELWQLPMPERLITEHASGSSRATSAWPTPTCADTFTGKLKSTQQKEGSKHSVNLSQAVRFWPTPSARQFEPTDLQRLVERREQQRRLGRNGNGLGLTTAMAVKLVTWPTPTASNATGPGGWKNREGGPNLQTAVKLWATPLSRDYKSGKESDATRQKNSRPLPSQVNETDGGQLNPDWDEALLNWPVGWTSPEHMSKMFWPAAIGLVVAQFGEDQHEWEPPRIADTFPGRSDRIRCIGNGQDPAALDLALRILMSVRLPGKHRPGRDQGSEE